MKDFIHKGIVCRCFQWQAEVVWSELPNLCQGALNASHSVSSTSTELEVACSITEYASVEGSEQTLESIIETVSLSSPPCFSYIKKVAQYASEYGGGAGAPLLKILDRFAKNFGEHKTLGEKFLTAVVDLQLSRTEKSVHLKIGLVAVSLVSDEVVGGITELLVKADVGKLNL